MPKETIWEYVKSLFHKKEIVENSYYNPLAVRIGRKFTFDLLDYSNDIYELNSIIVHQRLINDTQQPMVDYNLSFGDKKIVLRILPKASILLQNYFECEWGDEARSELLAAANDATGEFYIDRDTSDEQKFWKLYANQPIIANSSILDDIDGNGTVEKDEVKQESMSFWCFSRETVDADKVTVVEYLWIQLSGKYISSDKVDGGNKILTIMRGLEVDSSAIKTY